jgi:signal transduction histidine kinase
MNSLQTNILTLKQGGTVSGVELKPISSNFLDLWNTVNAKWNVYRTFLTQRILIPYEQTRVVKTSSSPTITTTTGQGLTKKQLESMASDLISSSDRLVTQLGLQTDKNSQDFQILQIIFGAIIIGILVLILYLVARMLTPIFDLTRATTEIKKGDLEVSLKPRGHDELSVLTESFNSMVGSLKEFAKNREDLTRQLKAANEELKSKSQLKEDFINTAAHELRGPIQPILGLAEVLRGRKTSQRGGEGGGGNGSNIDDSRATDEDLNCLDAIIRNAKRLLRLEQNILDMSRIESKSLNLDKERFNLIEKLQDVIDDFKTELSKEGVQLQFTPSQPEPIFVVADKVRVYEVLSNLLSNAIKFTSSKKGTITVKTDKQDSKAFVTVRDTGPGISSDIRQKLFSKYVTNSRGGTGIGLFIAKNIVEAHGGRIWAENNSDGNGATFTFSLPAAGE